MSSSIDANTEATQPKVELTADNYVFLQNRIYRDSGIVLDETKRYLIESRLLPIVRQEQLGNLNDLCARLRAAGNSSLGREVVEAMTTNETLFFRDPAVFDMLRTQVLPALVEKRRSFRTLSIWSAASSSGQEAYSVAMLLLDMGLEDWRIRILGTDLNTHIIERARTGRYTQLEVNRGLPAKYLVKHFERVGLEWQIKDQARRLTEFRAFDLRSRMGAFGVFDLVLCRNVLIYFDMKTKKEILAGILGILNRQGLLVLGSAETTLNIEDRFNRRLIGQTAFYEAP